MPIFDKAKWHTEGKFPVGLAPEQGSVHIGFFLGWVVERGMESDLMKEDFADDLAQFRTGKISAPRLLRITGGVLDDQLLDEEAVAFASDYYEASYVDDYLRAFPEVESAYHVSDTPESFVRARAFLDRAYSSWKESKK